MVEAVTGAAINVKERKTLAIGTTLVLLMSFAGMVTSAYTADHINRSSCDKSKDEKLGSAYKWATTTAVLSGLAVLATGALLVGVAMKKKSV